MNQTTVTPKIRTRRVRRVYWNEPETLVEQPAAEDSSPAAPSAPPAATSAVAAAPAARDPSSAASAAQRSDRPAAPGERELRFVFDKESWVEIRDSSDRTIFSQLNRARTAQRVTGAPPLSIVVGNANGVTMTYAGQPVDLARHTKIDVARLTLE